MEIADKIIIFGLFLACIARVVYTILERIKGGEMRTETELLLAGGADNLIKEIEKEEKELNEKFEEQLELTLFHSESLTKSIAELVRLFRKATELFKRADKIDEDKQKSEGG